ncbi:hypothetical protein CR513_36699, partial [Mucuna pruriens]
MMQIIEQWREERAQMKLDDARVLAPWDWRMFELIKQAMESVNIQRIEELPYELTKEYTGERVIQPNSHPSFTGPLATMHIENLDEERFDKNSVTSIKSLSVYTGVALTNSSKGVGHSKDQSNVHNILINHTYFVNANQENIYSR